MGRGQRQGPDLVVVYSPVGGGHKSAAIAVAEAARGRGLSVEIVDAFEHAPRWAGEAYLTAHLTGQSASPELYGKMYFGANKRSGVFDPIRLRIDNFLFGALGDHLRALAPRAIVATHHLPLVVLGHARRLGRLDAPVVGVVTDYTAHACWAEDGIDAWTVPCLRARDELVAHGAARTRVVMTGIPVRAAFERIPLLHEPASTLRVLVTSGGFGVGPLARIVRSFAGVADVELTVVCGAAPKVEARVAEEAARHDVRARVLGFENDMASRMAEADLVVGKAGGLTVTETLIAGRPMVIASAVPGNEKLNEELVTSAGAGVAALPDDVGMAVAELRARGVLAAMGLRARSLVTRLSSDRVVDVALSCADLRVAA